MKRKKLSEKTLLELLCDIQMELDDPGPFSHNLISLSLRHIEKQWGREYARKAFDELELVRHGWSPLPPLEEDSCIS